RLTKMDSTNAFGCQGFIVGSAAMGMVTVPPLCAAGALAGADGTTAGVQATPTVAPTINVVSQRRQCMRAMIRSPMAVRVVFLEVDTERAWAVASIGPGFIGAYLRAHGHEVGFIRAGVDASADEVVNR